MKSRVPTIFVLAVLVLGACNMSTPSRIKTGDIRIVDDTKTALLDAKRIDSAKIDMIADDYKKNGKDGVSIILPNEAGPKMAILYREAFMRAGISDIDVSYVRAGSIESKKNAVVFYRAVTALPPKDCPALTGSQGAETMEEASNYGLGCANKTALSKMISRPDDLMGRSGLPDGDSRRQGTQMEDHMSGKRNTKIQGINASTVGAGG